jgi:hypothetical protein
MSRIAAILMLFASAAGLSAQSLAELAEKEKARRAGLPTRSPVLTEEDLRSAQGTLSVTGEESPASESEAEAGQKPPEESERRPLDEIRRERIQKMEAWAAEWERRMAAARENVARLKEKAKDCRLADRMFFFLYMPGCEEIEPRLAAAEAELREIARSRYDYDRR